MKGLIRKAALLLGCAVGAATSIGCATTSQSCDGCGGKGGLIGHLSGPSPMAATAACCSNKDLYDRCYPERYNNLAKREVNLAFTPQVQNGHVLDQTVWNHHFEPGTDRLTPGGLAHLQYIARRRPQPDSTVYLATGLDLPYDPCCPERYCGATGELNSLRVAAIQKYLVALNCGRPLDYQVLVHDPADPSISATPAALAITQMYGRYRGGLAGGGGGGGTAGPSGSVGGFAGGGGAAGR